MALFTSPMKRRRFLELVATAIFSGVVGSGLTSHFLPEWKKSELKRHIRGIRENTVTLKTHTKYLASYMGEGKEGKKIMFVEGLIWGDYILTANHVINLTENNFML